ncbi:MAG: serine hydrolase [Saprospiraceae bacterium]|nr:serine hydrolase [Saprospiraceae bacterium]
MKKTLLPLLYLAFTITNSSAQTIGLERFLRDSLDVQMERGLKQWDIPGAAVCVVKGDRVLVAKGYGVCDLKNKKPVDSNTLFMIGSNTKAFTGTTMAMLEHEQVWSLSDRVQKWLPNFKMQDSWVAAHLNLTDIVSHRMGMETFQGDFMYWTSKLTSDQIIEKFGKLKPMHEFRTKWGYTNAGYAIAGACIKAATGKTWQENIKEKIFQPLEMNRSLALSADAINAGNLAMPYSKFDGELTPLFFANIDNLAPAGSIASSVNDMSHWLIAQLNGGFYKGKQVIPIEAIQRTRVPESILGRSRQGSHYSLYGLGWELQDFHGKEIVSHTGGVNGYVTAVTLLPEDSIGIVVLTNTDMNGFYQSMNQVLIHVASNLPYQDHHSQFLKGYENYFGEILKIERAWRDTAAMRNPSNLPLEAYTGRYENEAYGVVTLIKDGGSLLARLEHHETVARLQPMGGDRFLCTYADQTLGSKVFPFVTEGGKVKSFTLSAADFVEFTTYEFIKKN